MVSDQLLEEAGVLGEASVTEWPLFFIPLADDVLSLELDEALSDLYLVRQSSTDIINFADESSAKIPPRFIFPPRLSCYNSKSTACSLASSVKVTTPSASPIC
jgi:hypothetical protein